MLNKDAAEDGPGFALNSNFVEVAGSRERVSDEEFYVLHCAGLCRFFHQQAFKQNCISEWARLVSCRVSVRSSSSREELLQAVNISENQHPRFTCPLLDLASVTGLDPQRVFPSLFPCFIYKKDGNCSRVCSVLGLRHLKRGRYLGDGLRSIT